MNNELLPFYIAVYLILAICCVGSLLYVSFVRSRVFSALILTAVTFVIWRFNADLVQTLQQQYLGYSALRKALHAMPGFDPRSVLSWQIFGAGVLVFASAIVVWALVIFNVYINPSDYKRGTRLLTKKQMIRALKRSGVQRFNAIKVGDFAVPTLLETRSLGIFGEPGVGKTQLVKRIVAAYKNKELPVVAVDPSGELCQKYWRKRDFLLSPVLEKSVPWSPFSEIKTETDCKRVADASIPAGSGESVAWNGYARELYAHILRMLIKEGRATNRDLIQATQIASIEELRIQAGGTGLQRLFEKGNERMASSVLSVMMHYLSALALLDPGAGRESFSVSAWANGKYGSRGLWVPYYEADAAATLPLRCTWVNLLINSALSRSESPDRRVLFVLDELAASGPIDSLSSAVSRGRKYGLTLVLALQNVSQLYSIYGRDDALSILGSLGHMAVLRTPDPETSDYLSRTVGDVEVFKEEVSVNSEGGATRRFNQEIKRPVLASEISNLPDRVGYLKVATVGWVKLRVPLVKSANKISLVRNPMQISKSTKVINNTHNSDISDFDEV